MGREVSMVRRLEKIEKELGYCQIQLEKEQRVRLQYQFLLLERRGLVDAIASYDTREPSGPGNTLCGKSMREICEHLILSRRRPSREEILKDFLRAGSLPAFEEELFLIDKELDELDSRVQSFDSFRSKKVILLEEREEAMEHLGVEGTELLLGLAREFETIESEWNTLTEDAKNLDTALRHVSHAVDYLRSARGFILTARSQFNIETWIDEGYLLDLFKHSSIGRGKEMIEGADRNLRIALRELACLEDIPAQASAFENVLVPFLEALLDDLFSRAKLIASFEVIELKLSRLEEIKDRLEEFQDRLLERQERQEEKRLALFAKMGSERKRISVI